MRKYSIIFSRVAIKALKTIHQFDDKLYYKLMTVIESLAENPFQGKRLVGSLKERRSLRVGLYRILYTVENKKLIIHIFDVGHRREVYRKK